MYRSFFFLLIIAVLCSAIGAFHFGPELPVSTELDLEVGNTDSMRSSRFELPPEPLTGMGTSTIPSENDSTSTIVSCGSSIYIPNSGMKFSEIMDIPELGILGLPNTPESEINKRVLNILFATSNDISARVNRLKNLGDENPGSSFLAKNLISACLLLPSHNYCNSELNETVAKLDGNNGYTWSLISAFEATKGNLSSAKDALIKAASSKFYKDMYSEFLLAQKEIVDKSSEEIATLVQFSTINNASRFEPNYLDKISLFCTENANEDTEIFNTCVKFGTVVKNNAGSIQSALLGLAIKEETHYRAGELSDYAEIVNEKNEFRGRFLTLYDQSVLLASHDSRLGHEWYENNLGFGEVTAAESLISEAIQLSADPEYDPCKI